MKWIKIFFEFWSRLAHYGVGPVDSPLHKRTILTNHFGLTLTAIAVSCAGFWLTQGEIVGILFNLAAAVFFLTTLWLNSKGYHLLARFWIFGSFNLAMFLVVASIGKYGDSQTLFYVLAGIPFLLFEPNEKKSLLVAIAIPLILFGILFYFDFKIFDTVLVSGENNPLPIVTYFGTFSIIISCLYYLYRETEKAEKNLKTANYELLTGQTYLKSIIENIPLVFYTKGLDNRYTLINPEFEKLFKVKQKDILLKQNKDVFSNSVSRFLDLNDSEVLNTHKSKTFESFLDSEFGKTYLCSKFSIRGPLEESFGICGIFLDISERIKAQKALDEQRALVLNNMKLSALGEMANGMSHEMNTPLATISLMLESLQKRLNAGEVPVELMKKSLAKIQVSTERVSDIVAALSQFTGEQGEFGFSNVQLDDLLNDTLVLCQGKFKSKGIDLQITSSGTPYSLYCQPNSIGQVIYNILMNAYDAVANDERPWVKLKTEYGKNAVKITISNSGPQIPADLRDKIFQPFFTTKEVGKGQGLGLSISQGIINTHNGKLSLAQDEVDTSFIIELPLKKEDT